MFNFFKHVESDRVFDFFIFNPMVAGRIQDFLIFEKHWIGVELVFFDTVGVSERSGHGQNRIFRQNPTSPIFRPYFT